MIGLIIKNNLCRTAFLELLDAFGAENYQTDHSYDLLLTTDDCDCAAFSTPVITVGTRSKGAFYHIDTPVHPDDLVRQIQSALTQIKTRQLLKMPTLFFGRPSVLYSSKKAKS